MDIGYQWERFRKWCARSVDAESRLSWKFRFRNFWYLKFGFLFPHHRRLHYRYVISTAAYNVGPYIEDYFRSIFWQSANFRESIYIVITDDGSTDDTDRIVKKWQKRYPKNVTYLYKENGGVSSAKNTGMRYTLENIEADFITFTDSDDFLDNRYFYRLDRSITRCRCQNRLGIILCQPILFFEQWNIYSIKSSLQFRFENETKIIDVDSPRCFHFGSGYIFLPVEPLYRSHIVFDENISFLEDAIFVSYFLLSLPLSHRQLFLPASYYLYRQRKSKASLVANAAHAPSYFLMAPRICQTLLQHRALLPGGSNYKFVERFIILNYYYYFREGEEEGNCLLDQEVLDEGLRRIRAMLAYINTRMIECTTADWYWNRDQVRLLAVKGEEMETPCVHCMEVDLQKREIVLQVYIMADDAFQIFLDGQPVAPLFRKKELQKAWNRVWGYSLHLLVPYQDESQVLTVQIRGKKCNLWDNYRRKGCQALDLQAFCDTRRVQMARVRDRPDPNFWLLMDYPDRADDNAEYFYRFLQKHHPEREIAFVLERHSPHWKRLKQEGFHLIPFGEGAAYRQAFRQASKFISSQLNLHGHLLTDRERAGISLKNVIVLQSMERNEAPAAINSCRIALFTTASEQETAKFANYVSPYRIFPSQIRTTGLARHDALLAKAQTRKKEKSKNILVAPAWCSNTENNKTGNDETFCDSIYAKKWGHFLSSVKLKHLLEAHKCRLVFYPPPEVQPHLARWPLPAYVLQETCEDKSHQDILVESDLLITNNSPLAFEMAYLRRPVLYYRCDQEHYSDGKDSTSRPGYFDYPWNGFGPIAATEEALFTEFEKLLKRGIRPEPSFLECIEAAFPFRDGHCCERIYAAICELDQPRRADDFDRSTLIAYAEMAEPHSG